MQDPNNTKSCFPASTSKTQKSDCGGWGKGLGNNVSNTGRGVNSEPDRVAAELDAGAAARQAKHAKMRQSSAYKLARKAAKRERQAMRRAVAGVGVYVKRLPVRAADDATSDSNPMQAKRPGWSMLPAAVRQRTIDTTSKDIDTFKRREWPRLSKPKKSY